MRSPRFLVVVTACVLFCFGLAGCSTIQSETDEDAAACADYAVPDALRKKLDSRGLTSPAARADAAVQRDQTGGHPYWRLLGGAFASGDPVSCRLL